MYLTVQKDTWTEDEDRLLIDAHEKLGNRWAEIAKMLPGRSRKKEFFSHHLELTMPSKIIGTPPFDARS
jgi:hypothetical protein